MLSGDDAGRTKKELSMLAAHAVGPGERTWADMGPRNHLANMVVGCRVITEKGRIAKWRKI